MFLNLAFELCDWSKHATIFTDDLWNETFSDCDWTLCTAQLSL